MQITSTVEEHSSFAIHLSYWDLSLKFPLIKIWSEYVYTFAGTKPIDQLEAVPFDIFPDAEKAVEDLKARGRKIRDIPKGGLKWFKGFVKVPAQGFGGTRRRWIEGRVIIDPEEYDKMVRLKKATLQDVIVVCPVQADVEATECSATDVRGSNGTPSTNRPTNLDD